jgi:hypothetical protein
MSLSTKNTLSFICIFVLFYPLAKANVVFPKQGDTLNYTHVMFEFEEVPGADYYIVNIYNDDHLITKKRTTSLATTITGVLNFGEAYQWDYAAFTQKGAILYQSARTLFCIKRTNWCCADLMNMKTTTFNAQKMYQGLIIYDFGVITNKQGEIIWNLPQTDGTFRNLMMNKDGTLTYNNKKGSFETDLMGRVTWEAPLLLADSIKVKNYHHDIKKLPSGNYLCLAECDLGASNYIYNAVFELDRHNKLLWYWDEVPFYQNRTDSITSNHVNAVFMDELTKDVYLSNRNLNSITRLSRIPQPQVSLHIGKGYVQQSIQIIPQELFSGQHAVSFTDKNTILLFNNNTAHPSDASSVIELKKPAPTDKEVTVLWNYVFHFANKEENFCAKSGDADVLPNGNILITSGANNRVFEVSRNKKIVWENLSYRRDRVTDAFTSQSSYRAHFCSSLYPTYFTVQQLQTKVNKTDKIALKINNDGSENDQYTIAVLAANGTYKEINTIGLKAGKQTRLLLQINTQNMGTCTLKITSKNNPLYSKQVIYYYN